MSNQTIRIFTVASDVSKMAGLYESASIAGINRDMIEVLEVKNWRGFIDKILAMKSCVESLPDDTIVCFIDAYDVLSFGGLEEIKRKFVEYKADIIFSSELNCYPIENLARYEMIEYNLYDMAYQCPMGTMRKRPFWVRPIETNYKYVNSGGYIGYAGSLKEMFSWKSIDEIERIIELGGDQNFFTQFYLEFADIGYNGSVVAIDDHQRIFQSLYKVDLADFSFHRGRLYNHVLRTYPCFVHFNGYRDYGWVLRNIETGSMENAMEMFLRLMKQSVRDGNCAMTGRLMPFYYGGIPQMCIPQRIWGEGDENGRGLLRHFSR